MGGHGHDDKPPYIIPNPDIYKVEDVPQLKQLEEKLAKRGLKDPWIRNYVWRYQTRESRFPRQLVVLTRGWRVGVTAFLITIAVEKYFGIDYTHHDHSNDHSHENSHH